MQIQYKLSIETYEICTDGADTICTNIIEQLEHWGVKVDLVINKETKRYTDAPTRSSLALAVAISGSVTYAGGYRPYRYLYISVYNW